MRRLWQRIVCYFKGHSRGYPIFSCFFCGAKQKPIFPKKREN